MTTRQTVLEIIEEQLYLEPGIRDGLWRMYGSHDDLL